jgi:uncharacterized protein
MTTPLLPAWTAVSKPIIGMLHAPPLPGSPGYRGAWQAVLTRVLADAAALAAGGVDGLMLENFGDAPFYPGPTPQYVSTHLTALAAELRRRHPLPLGINVLRNDGCAAMSVAHAVGAEFIRVNVLCGARVTDQGIVQGSAHELLRLRELLGARHVKILADVNVKHSSPLGPPPPIEQEVADLLERGGADALIVSGTGTGRAVNLDELRRVKAAAGAAPVLIGSGANAESARALCEVADGFIVGTSLKIDGASANPVDPRRVQAFVAAVRHKEKRSIESAGRIAR